MLSDHALSELSSRIQSLSDDIHASPLVKGLYSNCEAKECYEAKECRSPSSVVQQVETADEPHTVEWESEWPALRFEELRLTHQLAKGETETSVLKRDSPLSWAERNSSMVSWLREVAGWSEEQAIAYTCISLGGQMAIAQALRDGSDRFRASQHLLMSVLSERGLAELAPPTYRHLSGNFSLSAIDAGWEALLKPDVAPGFSFTTSSLTICSDDPQCFDSRGYRVRLSTAKKLFYEPQDSDVVCFLASESEITVDTRSPAEIRTAHSPVRISSVGWHLPPLATVTLEKICAPGQWTAYGRTIDRRLFMVRIAYTC